MGSPLILHCLRKRFERNEIYTNVGTILISVNPYQRLPLYTDQVLKKYINRGLGVVDMPPHIFNIAHDAFYGVTSFGQNQSIIISGESGAGKTEATKQCLQYLARIAGSLNDVEKKVLQANPILEAFGNAKTLRNDNSSRFGKYLEIFFDSKGRIAGSSTESYLLEKIRVVSQASKERNFHIFYQLTKAAPAETRRSLSLGNPGTYAYLRQCTDVPSIDDARDFKEVMGAFKDLKFHTDEIHGLFEICSGILALGNCTFTSDGKKTMLKESEYLGIAAKHLGVSPGVLRERMTTREIRIRGGRDLEATKALMTVEQASETRHAVCKFVYGRMFNWLVKRINKAMSQGGVNCKGMKSIGILDIFGFEIFEHNSFEQLCINFTNEMLQQHFNKHTFKLEQAMYTAEGIQFDAIDFIDNQPMLDLITKKPHGVLPLLDEELVVPKGSDKGFLQKLVMKQAKNVVFKRQMKKPDHFVIKHYAGRVLYDSHGFLEKNRDTLTEELVEMLQDSKKPLLQALYPKGKTLSAKQRKSSLSSQFQSQLNRLMRNLNMTQPHYVRCIKPNNDKAPMKFVPRNCFEQLLYSGVFEAVAIRKQGFPFRLPHDEFEKRYSINLDDSAHKSKLSSASTLKAKCEVILNAIKCDKANRRIGKTRVLYRAEEHKKLELRRSIKVKNQEITEALRRLSRVDANSMDPKDREAYFVELAMAVSEADKFRVKTPDAEKARKMLEAFVEARMDPKTKRELNEAYEKQDLKLLQRVLAKCDKEGYRTKLTRKCQELLSKIEDAEAALEVALKSMREDYLEKAIDMCDEFAYKAPNAEKARTLLKNIKKAQYGISRAMSKMKRKWLNQALDFCDSFGYDSPDVQKCRIITQKVNICHRMLSKAKAAVDQTKLQKALQACERIKYRSPLEHEVRGLLFRVRRINEEISEGWKALVEDQVRTVVAAADEIKMTGGKKLKTWREHVKGPYDAFLKAQYDHAVKQGDRERAVRVMVRRKDLLVSEKKQALVLSKYPHLKDPMLWAREKWFGWDHETRASHMTKFQSESLHAPISTTFEHIVDTRHKKELRRQVTAAFETIQKFMGQRNTSRMPQRIRELLSDALDNKEIRSEVYMMFIKQCTDNPEPEKVPCIWELLSLCLSVFPPNKDFEDYLEAWLREPSNLPDADKYHCRGLLRHSVLNGADEKARGISEEELKDVSQALSRRLNPLRFAWPNYKKNPPNWADLKKSYCQKGSALKISKAPKIIRDMSKRAKGSRSRKREAS
uniref:Myosin motor domain-containing protein n=1 Tax=Lotharella globosa TaxID=91324 RepID=A0A7S4DMC0_9EUKA